MLVTYTFGVIEEVMAKTKKPRSEAEITLPPRRTETHRIDTQAVRVVRSKLTPDWVERSVEDRDYGIDMMLEAFDGDQPTGILILLQIKGHAGRFGDDMAEVASSSQPPRTAGVAAVCNR